MARRLFFSLVPSFFSLRVNISSTGPHSRAACFILFDRFLPAPPEGQWGVTVKPSVHAAAFEASDPPSPPFSLSRFSPASPWFAAFNEEISRFIPAVPQKCEEPLRLPFFGSALFFPEFLPPRSEPVFLMSPAASGALHPVLFPLFSPYPSFSLTLAHHPFQKELANYTFPERFLLLMCR